MICFLHLPGLVVVMVMLLISKVFDEVHTLRANNYFDDALNGSVNLMTLSPVVNR